MTTEQWFLPTNTNNLSMMISQGLITGPEGCDKYYADILKTHSGYIPTIKSTNIDKIGKAIKIATNEAKHLKPCIIVVDLKKIKTGTFYCEDGSKVDLSDVDTLAQSITTLYIPSPLPTHCILKVMFSSTKDKKEYENNAKTLYENVSLSTLKLDAPKSANKYFHSKELTFDSNFEFSEENGNLSDENKFPKINPLNYDKIYSFGGVVGSLFYMAKNGKDSENYFTNFSNFESPINDTDDYNLIKKFFTDDKQETLDEFSPLIQIFFPILKVISSDNDIKNDIIETLKSDKLQGEISERANEIANFLIDYSRNKIGKPASEIFEQSLTKSKKSKIEMLLFMLFFRANSEALFEYHLEIFEEVDYILFAILFGMRDKYSGLPLFLKEYEGLQFYISNIMATYAHNLTGSDISFKDIKSPPTLNSMLNTNKLDFVHWVSTMLEIDNSFNTVMPNKDFINSKGKSTYKGIVLPKLERINDKYFDIISKKMLDDELYNKILAKYKKF